MDGGCSYYVGSHLVGLPERFWLAYEWACLFYVELPTCHREKSPKLSFSIGIIEWWSNTELVCTALKSKMQHDKNSFKPLVFLPRVADPSNWSLVPCFLLHFFVHPQKVTHGIWIKSLELYIQSTRTHTLLGTNISHPSRHLWICLFPLTVWWDMDSFPGGYIHGNPSYHPQR